MTGTPARAHTQLLSASPKAGQVCTTSPAKVHLEFDDVLIDVGAANAIVVTDSGGARVDAGTSALQGSILETALPTALANGTYTVTYRVVSADSHVVNSSYTFTVAMAKPKPLVTATTHSSLGTSPTGSPQAKPPTTRAPSPKPNHTEVASTSPTVSNPTTSGPLVPSTQATAIESAQPQPENTLAAQSEQQTLKSTPPTWLLIMLGLGTVGMATWLGRRRFAPKK